MGVPQAGLSETPDYPLCLSKTTAEQNKKERTVNLIRGHETCLKLSAVSTNGVVTTVGWSNALTGT